MQSFSCRIRQESVFTNIGFRVRNQGLVCIQGGSGRGKSSLLFGIRGIGHKEAIYTGSIDFKGRPLDEAARSRIGLVLQNPHSQMISTLVREELVFCPGSEKDPRRDSRFKTAVAFLGLEPILDQPVRELSTGQKHMVAIGAAGVMNHDLLLMDEPFLYLDPSNITRVLNYIRHLRDHGMGVVVTSHPGIVDMSEVDSVVTLGGPEKAFSFSSEALFPDRPGIGPGRRCIALDRVGYGYGRQPLLADHLSFSIDGGTEAWIEGRNGSGKTTLLNILSGIQEPQFGRVELRGAGEKCRILTITQNPDRHFFESSVQKEMESAVVGKRKNPDLLKSVEQEIPALLECVGLLHKQSMSPFRLSFGEKVFLASAQAVLLRPDFIFVDDILGFLDQKERESLLAFLRMASRKTGCGLVFTSSRGRYPDGGESLVIRLEDHPPGPGPEGAGVCRDPDARPSGSAGRARPGLLKRIRRGVKVPAFDYMAGNSFLHRSGPMLKMGVSMAAWLILYKFGPAWYPHMACGLLVYYLSARMGIARFVADSRFFIIQTFVFAGFLPLFRWDLSAAGEGAMAGIRVWLFFIPVIVMMRTTTVGDWMGLFSRFLSSRKQLAIGIAFGLLPCITSDAGKIFQIQAQKGLVPDRGDLLHPVQLFIGLKAVFIPLLILIEDISCLAGLSVKLRGLED